MMIPLYKQYEAARPVAAQTITNNLAIVIYRLNDAEAVAAWVHEYPTTFHRHNIIYTSTGRAFIRKGGRRWYLDEFIKV